MTARRSDRAACSGLRHSVSLLAALLLIGLTACGAAAAEDVHADWLEAMRTNDHATAVELFADPSLAPVAAAAYLRGMASKARGTDPWTGGTLTQVEVVGLVDDGRSRAGYSVWSYARKQVCFVATLVETDRGWRVASWGDAGQPCSEAMQR